MGKAYRLAAGILIAWSVLWAALVAAQAPAPAAPESGAVRTVEARGRPIAIRVAVGRMTQVILWEPIASVVTNFTQPQMSFDTQGTRLYLAPLESGLSGELFIILKTDQQVTLAVIEDPERRDLVVQILPLGAEADRVRQETAELTALRLLRAMMLDRPVANVTVSKGTGDVVYNDGAVRLTLDATWRTPRLEGLILGAENLRPLWIRLPIERLVLPGLLAVHVEAEALAPPPQTAEERLAGRHRTRLYLVRTPQGR